MVPASCSTSPLFDYNSFSGDGNSVRFITGGTTAVNYGLNDPQDYVSNTNPNVFVPLLHSGNPLGGGASGSTPD